MFWKFLTLGFIMDSRNINHINTLMRKWNPSRATLFAEPVPSEDGKDFLKKITQRHEEIDTFTIEEILEKRKLFKEKYSEKSGIDERYKLEDIPDPNEIIFNITQYLYQMNLLRKLESDHVSIVDKMKAIEAYEKDTGDGGYLLQLKNGGLMKDW